MAAKRTTFSVFGNESTTTSIKMHQITTCPRPMWLNNCYSTAAQQLSAYLQFACHVSFTSLAGKWLFSLLLPIPVKSIMLQLFALPDCQSCPSLKVNTNHTNTVSLFLCRFVTCPLPPPLIISGWWYGPNVFIKREQEGVQLKHKEALKSPWRGAIMYPPFPSPLRLGVRGRKDRGREG